MNPKISVVIPAYNAELYLEKTLASVFDQSVPPHEIIVVDDGSLDKTVKLAKSFPVTVICQKNQGPAYARNTGVYKSTGDWIAFLDADDIWDKDKIKKTIECLRNHPDADIVCTNFYTGNESIGWHRSNKKIKYSPEKPFLNQLYRRSFIATSTVVLKKSVFNESGGFNSHFKGPEDLDLWLRIALLNKKLFVIQEDLTYYRTSAASLTSDLAKPLADTKRVLYRYRWNVGYFLFVKRIFILNIVTFLNQVKLKKTSGAFFILINSLFDLVKSPYAYYRY